MNSTGLYLGHNSSVRNLQFQTDETTRMTIAGNASSVAIGTTIDATYELKVSGDIGATGDVVAYVSDMRLKENIIQLDDALSKVTRLTGFTYNWNSLAKQLVEVDTQIRNVGLFAQDVEQVLPEAVKLAPFDSENGKSKSGQNYLTVQYDKLVPLLIEAIKEMRHEIDCIKKQLNDE